MCATQGEGGPIRGKGRSASKADIKESAGAPPGVSQLPVTELLPEVSPDSGIN